MEPIFFGIIKGEQPLVCNDDDRGQPQPAVSRDSNVSGGNAFCKKCKTQSTRKRSAREAHLSGYMPRHLNNFNKK